MKDKLEKIGRVGWVNLGGLMVDVKILDYKRSYGRDRWFVTPVSGSGEIWIENVLSLHAD